MGCVKTGFDSRRPDKNMQPSFTGGCMFFAAGNGKGVGETGVSPWRKSENRWVLGSEVVRATFPCGPTKTCSHPSWVAACFLPSGNRTAEGVGEPRPVPRVGMVLRTVGSQGAKRREIAERPGGPTSSSFHFARSSRSFDCLALNRSESAERFRPLEPEDVRFSRSENFRHLRFGPGIEGGGGPSFPGRIALSRGFHYPF